MKTAKLFIKGMREPLNLTEQQGLQAKAFKENISLQDDETVEIRNIWTGDKGDIRYVVFDTSPEYNERKKFSNNDLKEFGKELKPYLLKEDDDEFNYLVEETIKDIKSNKQFICSQETMARIEQIRDLHLSDDDLLEKAKELVRVNYVGKLTKKGEMRYLVDMNVIKITEDGKDFSVIQNSDKSILYNDLTNKLSEYQDYVSRITYAKKMDTVRLEELSEQVGNIE